MPLYNKRDVRARLRELLRAEMDDAMSMKGTLLPPEFATACSDRSNTLWWVLCRVLNETPRDRLLEIVQKCKLEQAEDAVVEADPDPFPFFQSTPVSRQNRDR